MTTILYMFWDGFGDVTGAITPVDPLAFRLTSSLGSPARIEGSKGSPSRIQDAIGSEARVR